jgi:hypothetical protein
MMPDYDEKCQLRAKTVFLVPFSSRAATTRWAMSRSR